MLKIERAIGAMLGANYLFAQGIVSELEKPNGARLEHRFWGYRSEYWWTDRSDHFTFLDVPGRGATLRHGEVLDESTTNHSAGFHLAQRMLCPIHAPIWGRPGDDWILNGPVEAVDAGVHRIELVDIDDNSSSGHVLFDLSTGRLLLVETPAYRWKLEWCSDNSEGGSPLHQFVDIR